VTAISQRRQRVAAAGVLTRKIEMVDIVMWEWIITVSLTVTIVLCLWGDVRND